MSSPLAEPASPRTLGDWLRWQERLHSQEIQLGLERVRAVADRLDLLPLPFPVVTVGGTNGKGSSIAILSSILRAAGQRVAVYTSPHLVRYNERIVVDGSEVADDELCAAFELVENRRGDAALTYFEYGTLAALLVFKQAAPDIAVLEVGLGGRLDAVNIVDATVALVTAIDIDHTQWLGDTRDAIAREKAGIFRAGRPAVCSDPDAPAALIETAREVGTPLELLGVEFRYERDGERWHWWSRDREYLDLPLPGLEGEYQLRNAAGALRVLDHLRDVAPVDAAAVVEGLGSVELPGRFQRIDGSPECYLDVAHNDQSAGELARNLVAKPCAGRTFFLLGMLKDKDARAFVATLNDVADEWHVADLHVARAADRAELERVVSGVAGNGKAVLGHANVEAAYAAIAGRTRPGDRIVVTGSFITVSQMMAARGIA
ncbi:MAG: bifunctional tetrahydrofolate synthase/dihydrofolate synthase [Gammaproteobacteria bacterium]|nr:bifunctional tetrahydrofolate synthase/dihydrofolate synthase [Gammaproteobacteria bacterium]